MMRIAKVFLLFLLSLVAPPIFSGNGIVLGPELKIANTTRWEESPQISYNPVEKNFLIAWIDRLFTPHSDEVSRARARFLSSKGVLTPTRTYKTGCCLEQLLIQNDPEHDQYLLLVDANYRLLGPSGGLRRRGRVGGQPLPFALTYHPLRQEYLMADPLRTFSYTGVPGHVLPSAGLDSRILIPDPAGGSNYFYFYDQSPYFYYKILHTDGTPDGPARRVAPGWLAAGDTVSIAFNPARREFLLVYGRVFGPWRTLRINENGVRLGKVAFLAGGAELACAAIYYGNRYFVAYNDDERCIYIRELDADGRALGPPFPLMEQREGVYQFGLARSEGRHFAIVWSQDNYRGFPPRGSVDIFGRLFRLTE